MASEMSERLLVVVRETAALCDDWDPVRAEAFAARHADLGKPRDGETPVQVAKAMIILSKLDARLGDYIEVERRSRVAVAAVRQDADPDVTIEVVALDLLASAQADLGKHQEAARSATEALELARRHPHERGGQILVRALGRVCGILGLGCGRPCSCMIVMT